MMCFPSILPVYLVHHHPSLPCFPHPYLSPNRWSAKAGSPSTSASWREAPRSTGSSWPQSHYPGTRMRRWVSNAGLSTIQHKIIQYKLPERFCYYSMGWYMICIACSLLPLIVMVENQIWPEPLVVRCVQSVCVSRPSLTNVQTTVQLQPDEQVVWTLGRRGGEEGGRPAGSLRLQVTALGTGQRGEVGGRRERWRESKHFSDKESNQTQTEVQIYNCID